MIIFPDEASIVLAFQQNYTLSIGISHGLELLRGQRVPDNPEKKTGMAPLQPLDMEVSIGFLMAGGCTPIFTMDDLGRK